MAGVARAIGKGRLSADGGEGKGRDGGLGRVGVGRGYGYGALGCRSAVVDGGCGGGGGGGGHLVLLLAYHGEQAVDLALLLVLELLVQLAQTRGTLVVGAVGPRGAAARRRALVHLAGSRQGRVVEAEVQTDAGATASAFDFSAHVAAAARRWPAGVLAVDSGVHGSSGCQRMGRGGCHSA